MFTDDPPPYVYQPYPRHMHGPATPEFPTGTYLAVSNDDEKAAALAAGWSLWPVPEGESAPDPIPERRKPGRPKKVAD